MSNASPKAYAEALAEPSSSSSVLNIKNITTTKPINEEWGRINLGPAEGFGVSRYHITRARELYPTLDPVAVQNLIYRFEKHLSMPDNRKTIRNPGAFFLSLAEKVSKGEMGLPEYKTPDEELLKKLHSDANERAEKAKALIRDIQDKVFETWWIESAAQEKDRLIPNSMVKGIAYKNAVRARWVEEAWSDTKRPNLSNKCNLQAFKSFKWHFKVWLNPLFLFLLDYSVIM